MNQYGHGTSKDASSFLFFGYIYFLVDFRLSCACVVIGTTCNIYVVYFLGQQAV